MTILKLVSIILTYLLGWLVIKGMRNVSNSKYHIVLRIVIVILISIPFIIAIRALGMYNFIAVEKHILIRIFFGLLALWILLNYLYTLRKFIKGVR